MSTTGIIWRDKSDPDAVNIDIFAHLTYSDTNKQND